MFSFFAFWCDTWKTQCPRLAKARGALSGLPIDLITVSIDGRWSDVPGYDPSLPCVLDRQSWSASIGVDRVPTTIVIDEKGRIRWAHSGVVRTEELVQEAREALKPANTGSLKLRIDGFLPSNAGFDLLDVLRRLQVHADLRVAPGISQEDPLIRTALDQGNRLLFDELVPGSKTARDIVDPYDSSRPGAAELIRRVLLAARPGATIVLHSGVPQTLEALPRIVAGLRKAGLEIVPD